MKLSDRKGSASGSGGKGAQAQNQQPSPSLGDRAEATAKLAAVQKSLAFTQIVSLMMRSPQHRTYSLSDLEWLFLPALQANQFRIAEAKFNGTNVPAGFLLWASVSPDVNKRLSETASAQVRLRPEDWRSGDILWIIEAVGDPRAIGPLLKAFRDQNPNGRSAKVRITSKDGKVSVVELGTLNIDTDATAPIGGS